MESKIPRRSITKIIHILLILTVIPSFASASNLVFSDDQLRTDNATIGSKLTFGLGEIIDNIIDGWLRITGNVNVTGIINSNAVQVGGVPQTGVWNSRVPLNNSIKTVDPEYSVGDDTSITIGSDGLPVISYYDTLGNNLKVVKCGDSACSSGNTITAVDNSTTSVGGYSSIAIGSDGLPVISYYDSSYGDLMVAKCGNSACSSGNMITTVDSLGNIGRFTSITIGSDGLPVIAYYDYSNGYLKVAKCGSLNCSVGNQITTIDSTNDVGEYTSIAIGADGFPVMSYYDNTNGDLKVAKCSSLNCSTGNQITTIDSTGNVGWFTSITIGSDGLPAISYYDYNGGDGDLKFVKCGSLNCSTGNQITTIDSTNDVGVSAAITVGVDGLPAISYHDNTNGDLKVAKCGSLNCSVGNSIARVDSNDNVGECTSVAIGADGLPVISYHDETNNNLKAAKCGSDNCIPYWTRR
ncbi:MAG: hypothetical protein NTU61_02605 [Candidatus Altiarchaeota archaeon]|nr:hypothetical protein [Candidatus Altiarchaeota archaeon]